DFITNDVVNNSEEYIFYDDVFKVIPVLYENYKLAIVSDAWPSLKDVYIHNDLLSYFDSFIISSQVKVTKPNQIIYQKALDELKILPNQALFIDDNLVNIKGAIKLGINGILLCRNKWIYRWNKIIAFGKKYQVIQNLEELINNEMIL
ncbi:MAG: HAD-IA family hydrolase, partial [Traorella sp.]